MVICISDGEVVNRCTDCVAEHFIYSVVIVPNVISALCSGFIYPSRKLSVAVDNKLDIAGKSQIFINNFGVEDQRKQSLLFIKSVFPDVDI